MKKKYQNILIEINTLYDTGQKNEALNMFLNFFENIELKNKIDSEEFFEKIIYPFEKKLDVKKTEEGLLIVGLSYKYIELFSSAIITFEEALKINDKNANTYFQIGYCYSLLDFNNKAISNYKKANKNKDNPYFTYLIGETYLILKKYKNVISELEKITKESVFYNNANIYKALAYINILRNDKDINYYDKAITCYDNIINNDKASKNLKCIAEELKADLKCQIEQPSYLELRQTINQIKKTLLFDNKNLTHYTGLSKTNIIIDKNIPFRISEASFLNDTSEGEILNKVLNINNNKERFINKPFIGSFVPSDFNDDLSLWRMYGKENSIEAKGCSLTFSTFHFKMLLNKKLNSKRINLSFLANHKYFDFNFYNVVYLKIGNSFSFTICNEDQFDKNKVNKLYKLISKLKDLVLTIQSIPEMASFPNLSLNERMISSLLEIAYLFKTAEYKYEKEVRLIIPDIQLKKKLNKDSIPNKVYIELFPIFPSLKKITIGPKVERAEEWAASFYYKLKNAGIDNCEIAISKLPYK